MAISLQVVELWFVGILSKVTALFISTFLSRDIAVCRMTHVFRNQLINYLLTGYPGRTEKY